MKGKRIASKSLLILVVAAVFAVVTAGGAIAFAQNGTVQANGKYLIAMNNIFSTENEGTGTQEDGCIEATDVLNITQKGEDTDSDASLAGSARVASVESASVAAPESLTPEQIRADLATKTDDEGQEEAQDAADAALNAAPEGGYTVGSKKTYTESYTPEQTKEFECRYVGEHCTVWRDNTAYDSYVVLPDSLAQKIGENFDANWDKFVETYGDYTTYEDHTTTTYSGADVDGDGKLAIICYDIGNDYQSVVETGAYSQFGGVAGFFLQADLYNDPEVIEEYGTSCFDCINIDTYPSMGPGTEGAFDAIDYNDLFSVLFHELQHLNEAAYLGVNKELPGYLNEGFSMAAQALICGNDCQSLADYGTIFQSSDVGVPLTYWCVQGAPYEVTKSYANGYVFSQYLRIRYAQLNPDAQSDPQPGSSFYLRLLNSYVQDHNLDAQAALCDLLQADSMEELVLDFWEACIRKDAEGIYGFGGEEWANDMCPVIQSVDGKETVEISGLYNGGALMFDITNADWESTNASNLVYREVDLQDDPDPSPSPTVSPDPDPSPSAQPSSTSARTAATGDVAPYILGVLLVAVVVGASGVAVVALRRNKQR